MIYIRSRSAPRKILLRPSRSTATQLLGTIVGGAAGAGAGTLLAGVHSEHPGVQIFVQRLDGNGHPYGQLASVMQDDDQRIGVGETVLLIRSRDGLSIAPAGDARADVEVTP